MALTTLEQWNIERTAANKRASEGRNGIACPKCGEELRDVGGAVMTEVMVRCLACGWAGRRLA